MKYLYSIALWLKVLVLLLSTLSSPAIYAQTISTYAGGFGEDMNAVTYGRLFDPTDVEVDPVGNVYVTDYTHDRIRKISASTGKISTVAGDSRSHYGGGAIDGVAISAMLYYPSCMVRDHNGNIYFADGQALIHKLDTFGIMTLICGIYTGSVGGGSYSGDGSAATAAGISRVTGIAIDRIGNIYLADRTNQRIRKIDTSGIINTIAGNGVSGFSGDGGAAIAAKLNGPGSVAVDSLGNVYISDVGNSRIRKVDTAGIITTAFTSMAGSLFFDTLGRFYVAGSASVFRLNSSGTFIRIAGNGTTGFSGDGGQATAAQINCTSMKVSSTGELIIADKGNDRVRKVNSAGIITTIAGNGKAISGYCADGDTALLGLFSTFIGLKADNSGNLLFCEGNQIRKINRTTGILSTVAGIGTAGFSGDGGQATAAQLQAPKGLAFDRNGNMFIADYSNHHVRKVSLSGIITTVAGGGSSGLGDGGPATAAEIYPYAVAVDTSGNLFIADYDNNRIRRVDASSGIITTVAGNGTSSGGVTTGTPATTVRVGNPHDVAVDKKGNLYISTGQRVSNSGIVTFIGYGGKLVLDSVGNLISTTGIMRDTNGYFHRIFGNGNFGYTGDGGPATAAEVAATEGIALDASGQIFVGIQDNFDYGSSYTSAIRKICCLSARVDYPPLFAGGSSQSLLVCSGSSANSISTLMPVSDGDVGDTIKWTVLTAPAHGTLNGFPFVATSTGGTISPTGMTYTPASGYSGADAFSIRIGDGIDSNITYITVNVSPTTSAGTITGSASICIGTPVAMHVTGATATGIWRVTNSHAVISVSGVDTGVTAGADTVLYIISNACGTDTARKPINIYSIYSAATLSGAATLCAGVSTTLTASASGGTWTSSNSGIATVSSGGIVTGVSGGSVNITYSLSNPCGTANAVQSMTIIPAASAGTISGPATVCAGASVTVSSSVSGGTWSATNSTATISAGGLVTGVSGGIDTISYAVSASCGTAVGMKIITVNPVPFAGTITGSTTTCVSSSVALSATGTGGTWTSTDPYVAVASSSGVISGVATGTAIITYTVSNSCGTASDTAIMTVNPTLSAGAISGSATVCAGSTVTLTSSGTGGSWASGNPSVATVSSTGVVTGVTGGAALISYTVTNVCGTAVAISLVNVTTASSIGAITGPTSVCSGSTITLAHATTGGAWSSSTTSVATINSSGVVSGITAGVTTISYSVSAGCGVSIATTNITVNAAPVAGTLSGPSTFCVGATSVVTSSISGGSWSSSASSIASISATGVITGMASGSVTFTYTVTNSCGAAMATYSVSVYAAPIAGTISGTSAMCAGTSVSLSSTASGGSWSSSATSIATVNSSGTVTGIAAGTATISYTVTTGCGTASATYGVTVNATTAGTISGATTACPGGTVTLTSSVSGGTWSSGTSTVATISSSGVITAITTGVTIISYTVSGTCGTAVAIVVFSVNSLPSVAAIGGPTTLCTGTTTTLTESTTGGSWSSGTPSVATITSTGVVTGISSGTSTISYSVTAGCGTTVVTATVTVNSAPSAGTISGAATICAGSASTFSGTVAGGSWSSSNTAIATTGSATGIITGVAAGSVTISYTVTNSCGTATATTGLTVSPLPNAGSVSGASSICVGTTTNFSDGVSGGTWSSSNSSIASIDPSTGIVGGVATGSAIISYTVANSCGTAVATQSITINAAPSAGALSIGTSTLCPGTTTAVSSTVSGGLWSSGSGSIATVNASGIITAISVGTTSITYAVTNSCGTALTSTSLTVTPSSAGAISGVTTLCPGGTSTLTSSVSGGTWSSSASSIATISSSGVITAITAGATVISYSISGSCGTAVATLNFTVGTPPTVAAIAGSSTLCTGTTTTLTDGTASGSWSSGTTSVATINSSGVVTAVSTGTTVISYTVSGGCGSSSATMSVSVQAAPTAGAISGTATACSGTTTTLTASSSGGTWSSSNTTIATINASGIVTGVSAGTAIISYAVSNTCGTAYATVTVTIDAPPFAGTISGVPGICAGTSTTLTDPVTGGTWSSTNTSVATIGGTGVVTGLVAGTTTISYTLSNACGTNAATITITVNPLPVIAAITGASSVATGSTTTLSDATSGGTWTSNNTSVATINSTGVVTGVAAGTATITYAITNSFGCSADTTTTITVTPPSSISDPSTQPSYQLFPNPSTGDIAISWQNLPDPITVLTLTDVVGREVFTTTIKTNQPTGTTQLNLSTLQQGIYVVTLRSANSNYTSKLVVE